MFAKASKAGKIFKVEHVDMLLSEFTGFISAVNDEAPAGYTRVNYIKDGINHGGLDIQKSIKGSTETIKFKKQHLLNSLRAWSETESGLLAPESKFKTLNAEELARVEQLEQELKNLRG